MSAQHAIQPRDVAMRVLQRVQWDRKQCLPRRGFLYELIHGVVWFSVLGIASYVIATHYVVGSVRVSGISMAPTINDSDYYLLEHLTYLWRNPERGDIVVIRDPTDETYAIKRVIATGGELLYIKDGKVYVDGKLLVETYLPEGMLTRAFSTSQRQVIKCRKNEVAVLGDNRDNSLDSRYYGSVSHNDIVGLVMR
jgi:signal peptidase I